MKIFEWVDLYHYLVFKDHETIALSLNTESGLTGATEVMNVVTCVIHGPSGHISDHV